VYLEGEAISAPSANITLMLCAAIDIGSNTTRLLVAEPDEGQLRKIMEQRAYTRIGKDASKNGKIAAEKIAEVAEVVTTQVRLAEEMGAEVIKTVATAAIREAKNRDKIVKEITKAAGVDVDVLSEEEEGRLAFIGATKSLGHPVEGTVAVVDVGGGSSEVIYGTIAEGVSEVRSWKIGSGSLTEEFLESDPPSASEIRALRDHIGDLFEGDGLDHPDQAVAVGGSATSLRTLVGAVLEYETLERAVRVLCSDEIADVAKRFELDPRRVKLLPAGVLLLEKFSQLLGQPLQIGKGGLREGIILELLNGGSPDGSSSKAVAA
jgi:exopolyphosphatase/guanosine-5'-triphosphate,3'-diphosphate pyrophosphatase